MKECHRCHRSYTPINNVGRFKCVFHPGTYQHGEKPGYTCCGRKFRDVRWTRFAAYIPTMADPVAPRGCTRCDCGSKMDTIVLSTDIELARHLQTTTDTIYGLVGTGYDMRVYRREDRMPKTDHATYK